MKKFIMRDYYDLIWVYVIYIWNNFTDNIQLYKREEQAKTTIVLDDGGEMEMVPSTSPNSPSEGS